MIAYNNSERARLEGFSLAPKFLTVKPLRSRFEEQGPLILNGTAAVIMVKMDSIERMRRVPGPRCVVVVEMMSLVTAAAASLN